MGRLLREKHLEEMNEKGIDKNLSAPPLHQFAWKFGFNIEPPLIAGFMSNALFMGSCFGLGFGIIFSVITLRNAINVPPLWLFILMFSLSGCLFGVSMAVCYRVKAKAIGLLRPDD